MPLTTLGTFCSAVGLNALMSFSGDKNRPIAYAPRAPRQIAFMSKVAHYLAQRRTKQVMLGSYIPIIVRMLVPSAIKGYREDVIWELCFYTGLSVAWTWFEAEYLAEEPAAGKNEKVKTTKKIRDAMKKESKRKVDSETGIEDDWEMVKAEPDAYGVE